ncbi:TIGR04500 family putative peptide maturation system protein [Microbispora sp. NBC_01189]|uniref:TIGR04500 family putative peptide maturation system protein n=1 Tax=Microbispora sp. NBC_01189 TaxID=2903583 RepID=UPI002E15F290|nr:TIGR04500 family putative peptide maturation system protein [Microbispora sp. NBC_01189]
MPLFPDHLLNDALAFLRRVSGAEPADARRLLGDLRAGHPDVPMRLVWQRDHPGGSHHYDLLIPAPDGTVSVAFAPARAVPWPLRGSHGAGEQVVVRVDGVDVRMEQAMAVLDGLWGDSSTAARLVNAALVEQELEREPVELSAEELQEAMDAFRRSRRLLTVRATRDWMAERGLDHASLEMIVHQEAAIARLRRRVAADGAAELFAADPGDHDRLCVVRLRYPHLEAARAAAGRLRDRARPGSGPLAPAAGKDAAETRGQTFPKAAQEARAETFAKVAEESFEYGADVRPALVYRRELGPDAVGAGAGDVLGDGPEPLVTCVLEVRPAVLDDETRRAIENRVFDDWLARRRAEASVEWMWGTARRTGSVTRALRTPDGSRGASATSLAAGG